LGELKESDIGPELIARGAVCLGGGWNMGITDSQIQDLRTEALMAGDAAQVELCNIALGWAPEVSGVTRESARRECARVIRDAAAQAID
jgi:hypothetical protein